MRVLVPSLLATLALALSKPRARPRRASELLLILSSDTSSGGAVPPHSWRGPVAFG